MFDTHLKEEKLVQEHGSFRDREARIFYMDGEIFRTLSEKALLDWEQLVSTQFFNQMISQQKLVQSELVPQSNIPDLLKQSSFTGVLKHQVIPFISYPYEWCFGMLKDAALLHLELIAYALKEDMMLKDSSSFNIQWIGSNPIFIDISSFEKYLQGTPWVGYNQFCQMFLNPLFLQAYKDIPFHSWLRGRIDGIEPEQMARLFGLKDLFLPGVFTHVYLHSKMQESQNAQASQSSIKSELSQVGFNIELIRNNIRKLQKIITELTWKKSHSVWSDYADNNSYHDHEAVQKADFVRDVIKSKSTPWQQVWDMGCNTGRFSRIAAENAKYVIALDSDHLAVEKLYQNLKKSGTSNILPLVFNLADPSPGLGWKGLERKPLWERGKPDLILALALIHHVVISANIPLKEFIIWLAELNADLVIEFITKNDPMVQTLLRNKTDNYSDYDQNYFEECLSEHFVIQNSQNLINQCRTIYFCQRKN